MRVLAFLGLAAATADEPKNRPVQKVIKLLKDMQSELENEAEQDAVTNKKMECWCDHTIKETGASIDENNNCIARETASIEDNTGARAKLKVVIENTEKDIKDQQQSLADETARREKEQGEFLESEKDLVASIGALKNAITVLNKHQPKSFLQVESKEMGDVVALIAAQLGKAQKISGAQKREMQMFLEQPSFGEYTSQSGEIFGILASMNDEFQDDLEKSRNDESAGVAAFSKSKKTKEDMIKQNSELLKRKKAAFGKATQDLASAEENLGACQDGLEKDQTMLQEAKESCQKNGQEYGARTAARKTEQEAVAKALEFLNSDEAHELFSKNFNFVQTSMRQRATVAKGMLRRAAADFGDDNLLVLAQKVKAGAFVKVIRAIENMVKELKGEMKKDVEDKDACVSSINEQTKELQGVHVKIQNGQALKERLEQAINSLTEEIQQLNEKIAADQANLVEAGADRQEANALYQQTVSEQSGSIAILKKALQVLANVYAPKLLQQPATYKAMDKNAGGNKVLTMIQEIISDAEKELALAIQDENNSQKDYERMVRDTNASIDSKQDRLAQKEKEKGQNEEKLQSTEDTLNFDMKDHESRSTQLTAKKEECKFLMDNFGMRQEHMQGEIDALNKAKAFLNGMN